MQRVASLGVSCRLCPIDALNLAGFGPLAYVQIHDPAGVADRLCEETGHEEDRCPTRPCPACGLRTHRHPTHHACPELICSTCNEKGRNRTNCPSTQCEICSLFGHLPSDCVDVDIDWLNISSLLSTKRGHGVNTYFESALAKPTTALLKHPALSHALLVSASPVASSRAIGGALAVNLSLPVTWPFSQ